MKNLFTYSAVALTFSMSSTMTLANENDILAGFYVSAGINNMDITSSQGPYSINNAVVSGLSFQDNDTSKTKGEIAVGYNFRINEKFLLGFSYERMVGDVDQGTIFFTLNGGAQQVAGTSKLEKISSLMVSPTLQVSDTTAISLRLGQTKADGLVYDNGTLADSLELSGNVYGIGLRHHYTDHVFFYGSYDSFEYDDEPYSGVEGGDSYSGTAKGDGSMLKLGIGYRF